MFRKVVVGISGGVDSAVSAFLLKERGYNVLGVFMKNWDEYDEFGRCTGEADLRDAEYTCNKLGIELKQINYVKEYWNSVFVNFLEDYQNGLTPNPDLLCNKHIKFDLFCKYVFEELKYDAMATGHYARTSFGTYLQHYKENGKVNLLIPKDTFKDQTFFLAAIKRSALCRTMFPLDNLLKSEVKQLAQNCKLSRLAKKKESTGICFVGNRSFPHFISEYVQNRPGNFIDIDSGLVAGQHEGIHKWTVGQRCRLANYLKAYFVASKDVHNNIIYVAAGSDNPALYSDYIVTNQLNWLCDLPLPQKNAVLSCKFRFQHTKPLVDCNIYICGENNENLSVLLNKPMRAVTPGQYAVFYKDDNCLGSARIVQATKLNYNQSIQSVI